MKFELTSKEHSLLSLALIEYPFTQGLGLEWTFGLIWAKINNMPIEEGMKEYSKQRIRNRFDMLRRTTDFKENHIRRLTKEIFMEVNAKANIGVVKEDET